MAGSEQKVVLEPLTCEHLAPGLMLERSADRTLCMFIVRDGRLRTIDAWENWTRDILSEWPTNSRCLLLHDFNQEWLGAFGAGLLARFERLYALRPELERKVAIVLPRYIGLRPLIELDIKVRVLGMPYGYTVHWEIFTKRADALQWLVYQ